MNAINLSSFSPIPSRFLKCLYSSAWEMLCRSCGKGGLFSSLNPFKDTSNPEFSTVIKAIAPMTCTQYA